ncbi:hypothetical protein GCM10010413_01550 [Promicromonospora sukumoe]
MQVEVRLGEKCEVAHLRSVAKQWSGGSRDRDTPHYSHIPPFIFGVRALRYVS